MVTGPLMLINGQVRLANAKVCCGIVAMVVADEQNRFDDRFFSTSILPFANGIDRRWRPEMKVLEVQTKLKVQNRR